MIVLLCYLYITMILLCFFVFFFFKQKTAYEMRISDWSSDVCSSDLDLHHGRAHRPGGSGDEHGIARFGLGDRKQSEIGSHPRHPELAEKRLEIGRASCRERVCQYV